MKIVVIALDCLQKLIAYGHLIGDCPYSSNPDRLLIDRIVETICLPFQGPTTDDAIQLQIIKAILALVLSNTCRVHEGSMLLAVRTCFNIYLASRSAVNQSTARGILTQTINSVFTVMERLESEVGDHTGEVEERAEVEMEEDVRSVLDAVVGQVAASSPLDQSNPFSEGYTDGIGAAENTETGQKHQRVANGDVHHEKGSNGTGVGGLVREGNKSTR